MAHVVLRQIHKTFTGTTPVKKRWYEFWRRGTAPTHVHAVQDVSLKIEDGEFLVLVGPSGCGKTTLLRMVAGLEEVSSGEIYIGDRLVNDVQPRDRDIAMVFQNYALYPHMSVYENMAFGLRLRRVPPAEIEGRVQDAAELLGIGALLARKPKELSGGQRQRVAMGRAIVREPKVFLMDEPLSNLDAKLRGEMRAELQKLHRRLGVTTIYVTHDQTEAMTLGDRIVLMKDGVIQQQDAPQALYEAPANMFVAGFIGSPSMNFVPVRVQRGDGGAWSLAAASFTLQAPPDWAAVLEPRAGQTVVLGVRPEDLQDSAFAEAGAGRTVSAVVDVLEPMGSEVFAFLTAGPDTLVARLDPRTCAKVGSTLEIVVDTAKLHLFDSDTQRRLMAA